MSLAAYFPSFRFELLARRTAPWVALGASLGAAACSAGTGGQKGGAPGLATGGSGGAPSVPQDGQGANISIDLTGIHQEVTQTPYCLPEPFPKDYSCTGPSGPWGEALQKTLWFFNVNKSGPGVYCTDVQWRGDAHVADGHIKLDPADPNGVRNLSQAFIDAHRDVLDPDGDGEVDLAGGYHDAGDYIKFTLTQAYAASMIAWSLYEYPESFQTTGLTAEALGQVRWAADYLMKATFRDADGKLVAYAHQVADITDHSCFWMPPEVRRPDLCPRPAYFITDETPAADVTAAAAATLALTGLVIYRNRRTQADVDYAERCVDYAKSLYEFASRYPEARATDDGGLYNSNSTTDDLAWAAIWLYLVNPAKNGQYLDAVVTGDRPWLSFGSQATILQQPSPGVWVPAWAESSPHSWDAVRAGVIAKLARIMTERSDPMASEWVRTAREMAFQFKDGGKTPDGFYVYMSWGSARYNSAAQFTTLLFTRDFPDDPDSPALRTWAETQIDYILGKNDLGLSYVMGYTDSFPLQPHHAAGHASIYGQPAIPEENRHIIWGALVNGPEPDGTHVDDRDDYGSNEVTIDYNAALVAALAAHYPTRGAGECPLREFPPLEPPIDEFYAMGNLNMELGGCRTQVAVRTMNESIHPPRYDTTLTTRFWFDASELIAVGLDPATAVTGQIVRDTGPSATPPDPTEMKGPIVCDEDTGVYYFEFDYTGSLFWGLIPAIGAPRDVLLDYGLVNNPGCPWNPMNDWSLQYLTVGGSDEVVKTPYITVYSDGQLIWGQEPPCMGEQKKVEPPPDVIVYIR